MPEPISIAIVDDHPIFRDGVERAVRRQRALLLTGSGTTAADAVDIVREKEPDILLLDIGLPGGGISAAKAIKELGAGTKVIMLTGLDDDQVLAESIDAGAVGYVLKGVDASELLKAIRTVYNGEPYITPALSTRLLIKEVRSGQHADAHPEITARERQLLELASHGMTNGEIAARLDLALPTVKNSMSKLFDKLGARFAQRNGGYTRIVRVGWRQGDGAEQAMLELVGSELVKRAAERAKRREERLKQLKEGESPDA